MDNRQLKTWLQLHLATDDSAVTNLPFLFNSLVEGDFLSQGHVQEWTIRINSLICSKDPGARWAGLSIALRTATLSRDVMNGCAQAWVTAALPILFENETLPCLKACIHLIRLIFVNGIGRTEFQRQVVLPNIVKFSQALVEIVGRYESEKLKILCLATLSQLVPLFPSSHKQLHASLSALALKYLNGSSPAPSSTKLVTASSKLYATLPCTGGKVGASSLWRKSVDETLEFTREALSWLNADSKGNQSTKEDPMIYIPLNLDRLRAGITVLCDLLSTPPPRPVQVPIGQLSELCVTLLSCDATEQSGYYVDPSLIDIRTSTLPNIWELAVDMTVCLLTRYSVYLLPNMPQILSCVAHHLERKPSPVQMSPFLRVLVDACAHCRVMSNSILMDRLVRAVIPYLTKSILSQSETKNSGATDVDESCRRKGKKRTRGYEGDEVLKSNPRVLFDSRDEERVVILSIEALRSLLRDAGVSPEVCSLSSRLLLSLFLHVSRLPPHLVSRDPTFHGELSSKLRQVCIELASTKSVVLGRALPLLINLCDQSVDESSRTLDVLLRPRLPPLVRSLPPVENVSLFRAEESEVEQELRGMLGLAAPEDPACMVSARPSPPGPSRGPNNAVQGIERTASPRPVPNAAPSIVVLSNPVTSTITSNEGLPPSWNSITSVGDEDEEEDEEIPSINMDSDSD